MRIIIYIPVLIVIAVYLTINILFKPDYLSSPVHDILEGLIMISWILGTFYFSFMLIKALLKKKKIIEYILISLLWCFMVSLVTFYLLQFNKRMLLPEYEIIILKFKGWLIYTIYAAVIGGFGVLYRFAIDWFQNLNMREQLETMQLKSEISMLKSKLNPHFLFNTLNNIDTLIETDSTRASDYLGRLSSILRYIVYDTENERVEISKELDCIKDYVELQKLRTDDDDIIQLKINGTREKYEISPGLLLPFVENIFKHGDQSVPQNKVHIEADIENGNLRFSCLNHFDKKAKHQSDPGGVGIDTTRKRLELLYKDRYRLDITKSDQTFSIKLKIDLNDH